MVAVLPGTLVGALPPLARHQALEAEAFQTLHRQTCGPVFLLRIVPYQLRTDVEPLRRAVDLIFRHQQRDRRAAERRELADVIAALDQRRREKLPRSFQVAILDSEAATLVRPKK